MAAPTATSKSTSNNSIPKKTMTITKITTTTVLCILGVLLVLWIGQSLYLVSSVISFDNTASSFVLISSSSSPLLQQYPKNSRGAADTHVTTNPSSTILPYKYNNTAYRLLQQYKQWHSEKTLQKEWTTRSSSQQQLQELSLAPDRRYAIGYYSCPLQAGNRMGAFVEAMIWSMITNRTLLWKYYSQEDCTVVGKDFNAIVCDHADDTTEQDCAKVLQRAAFLPSYDVWKDRIAGLAVSHTQPTILRHYVLFPLYQQKAQKNRYWYKDANQDNGLADTISDKLVVFPIAFFNTIPKWETNSEKELLALLKTPSARQRARQLRQTDVYYAYALFLFETFSIQPQYQVPPQFPPAPPSDLLPFVTNEKKDQQVGEILQKDPSQQHPSTLVPDPTRNGITIVVHSRHIQQDNDGSSINNELNILEPLLRNNTSTSSSSFYLFCQVILLSDRIPTIQNLQHYLQTNFPHCFIGLAPHDTGTSFESEHGPFAGVGFYQDLSFVHSQIQHVPTTRTVFVGSTTRSSGQLVMTTMIHAMYQQEQYNSQEDSLSLRPPHLEAINLDNNT